MCVFEISVCVCVGGGAAFFGQMPPLYHASLCMEINLVGKCEMMKIFPQNNFNIWLTICSREVAMRMSLALIMMQSALTAPQ